MTTTALAVAAGTWGVVMALSPVLQIRRILHRRSSHDVSISYLFVLLVGFSLWVSYGIAIRNPALIVANAIALVVGVAVIVVALRYRRHAGALQPEAAQTAPSGSQR
jgi:MtN3 and saliva related transmembrane protein